MRPRKKKAPQSSRVKSSNGSGRCILSPRARERTWDTLGGKGHGQRFLLPHSLGYTLRKLVGMASEQCLWYPGLTHPIILARGRPGFVGQRTPRPGDSMTLEMYDYQPHHRRTGKSIESGDRVENPSDRFPVVLHPFSIRVSASIVVHTKAFLRSS